VVVDGELIAVCGVVVHEGRLAYLSYLGGIVAVQVTTTGFPTLYDHISTKSLYFVGLCSIQKVHASASELRSSQVCVL
jgi:hypothetical protein